MGAAEPHALLFFNVESHFHDRMDLVDDFRKDDPSLEPQLIGKNVVSSRLSLRLQWERSTRYIICGTSSKGAAATQGRRAAADSGRVNREGRWESNSTLALRTKAEGATMRHLTERPGAAVMVIKKQGRYLVLHGR